MARSSKRLALGRATYSAQQMGDELMLFASGVHPTSGFKEFFETVTSEGPTPELSFFFIEPEPVSDVSQVVTPFQHSERFRVRGRGEAVIIRDRDGRHEVRVESFPEEEARSLAAEEGLGVLGAEVFAVAEPAQIPAAAVGCDVCVRQTVALWANNDSFSNSQTLGQIYRRGSCNNGALSQLFQAIQGRCGQTPLGISCSTTVRQLIRSTCP